MTQPVLREGLSAIFDFVVTDEDMRVFCALSGDRSSIHTDAAFARARGYSGVIVYGGIILAKLSYLLGAHIPGDRGTSTHWSVDYRRPLYVGERATIKIEIVGMSPATGLVDAKFTVRAPGGLIAAGRTQSMVPLDSFREEDDGL